MQCSILFNVSPAHADERLLFVTFAKTILSQIKTKPSPRPLKADDADDVSAVTGLDSDDDNVTTSRTKSARAPVVVDVSSVYSGTDDFNDQRVITATSYSVYAFTTFCI